MTWQAAALVKQNDLWKDVPAVWKIDDATVDTAITATSSNTLSESTMKVALHPKELEITMRPATQLLAALAAGDLTAHEVLEAFAHRAVVAHQLTTCLSELDLAAARLRVRELDGYWRAHASPIGPLHGLPVSLMDRFHVAGLDSACAFASWVGQTRTSDDEGTLVRALRQLGAVVHCKTNVPMSMMLGETCNNIIGTTTNPFNVALSAGGACGGEGALLALSGSCLGIGTDVAGSGRLPAAFCGLWSLKCSQARLADDGIASVLSGIPVAGGSIALLSGELAALTMSFKCLVDSRLVTSNPNTLELPWRPEKWDSIQRRRGSPSAGTGRLVFGVLTCDGHVRPHPAIQRALQIVINALEAAGHEVITWDPPPHAPAVHNLFEIFGSTSALEARTAIDASGEPPIPQIADWYYNQDVEPNSTSDFWRLCEQRNEFCTRYKAYWNGTGQSSHSGRVPDGVILPVAPTLAVRPEEFRYYGYSAIVNVLDYTSGVFPVTFGDRDIDRMPDAIKSLSAMDDQVRKTCESGAINDKPILNNATLSKLYAVRADDHHGMPVGLQVMCPRLQEEVVLALMDVIATSLHHLEQPERE